MKILMTNYYLGGVTGSETWTYTVADELKRRGHGVRLVCMECHAGAGKKEWPMLYVGRMGMAADGFKPDVIHAHHNGIARIAREVWPDVPMVYVCHSTFEPLEEVPDDCGLARVLCVSPEVQEYVTGNTEWSSHGAVVIGQPVNVKRFRPLAPVHPRIRRILVVSARMGRRRARMIEEAAHCLRAAVKFVGGEYGWQSQGAMVQWYNWADVVFSMGRGVYEAMCCARVPVIFDKWGAGGMVTPENVGELARRNFSGRGGFGNWSLAELVSCLGRYDAESTCDLRRWAVARCDVGRVVGALEEAYREAVNYGTRSCGSRVGAEVGQRGSR